MKLILLSVDVEVYLCESLSWEKKTVIIILFDNLKSLEKCEKTLNCG